MCGERGKKVHPALSASWLNSIGIYCSTFLCVWWEQRGPYLRRGGNVLCGLSDFQTVIWTDLVLYTVPGLRYLSYFLRAMENEYSRMKAKPWMPEGGLAAILCLDLFLRQEIYWGSNLTKEACKGINFICNSPPAYSPLAPLWGHTSGQGYAAPSAAPKKPWLATWSDRFRSTMSP